MHVSDDAYFDKRLFMLQGAARLAGEADRRQAEHLGVAGNALPRPRLGGWSGRCRIQLGLEHDRQQIDARCAVDGRVVDDGEHRKVVVGQPTR
jgi:hypothetical protein